MKTFPKEDEKVEDQIASISKEIGRKLKLLEMKMITGALNSSVPPGYSCDAQGNVTGLLLHHIGLKSFPNSLLNLEHLKVGSSAESVGKDSGELLITP